MTRKYFMKVMVLFLFIFWPVVDAAADVVELANGSKIIGIIQKLDKNHIFVKTDFSGTLKIDLTHVIRFSSEKPLMVCFADQRRVFGKVTYAEKLIRVEMPHDRTLTSGKLPERVWREDLPDPYMRHWGFEAGFDVAGKTGNTERISIGGKAQAELSGPDDRLLLYLKYSYARDDGNNSDNVTIGGIDFERYLSAKHSLYARNESEHDRIKDLNLRNTTALGYGHYFLKSSRHMLRGRVGLMYRHESWENDSVKSSMGTDFGLYHMFKFVNGCKLLNEITYTPSLKDYQDYRIYHESSVMIPLAGSNLWKLQLGVANEYNSLPAQNNKYLDTSYFSRMMISWP